MKTETNMKFVLCSFILVICATSAQYISTIEAAKNVKNEADNSDNLLNFANDSAEQTLDDLLRACSSNSKLARRSQVKPTGSAGAMRAAVLVTCGIIERANNEQASAISQENFLEPNRLHAKMKTAVLEALERGTLVEASMGKLAELGRTNELAMEQTSKLLTLVRKAIYVYLDNVDSLNMDM